MRTIVAACIGGGLAYLGLLAVGRWQNAGSRYTDLPPMSVLRRRYFTWEAASFVAMWAIIGLTWLVLVRVADAYFADTTDTLFLAPRAWMWAVPALFIGIVASVLPIEAALRRGLGPRYDEFEAYQIVKFGYDSRPLRAPVYGTTGLLSVVMVAALFDWYVRFGPSEIEFAEFGSRAVQRLAYDDVLEIRFAERRIRRDGSTAGPLLALHFADGHRWRAGRGSPSADVARLRRLAEFVAQRSGLPIHHLDRSTSAEPMRR